MPPKKEQKNSVPPNVGGLKAAVVDQPISETLTKNFMPYAMSVIMSRAIPEIDGFKPSHRKLLYTMYKMGLLTGARTKSANVVGQTMRLNPHGEGAIYETMVRLSRGNESLLHPFVDSKGNFGKVYSRDMAYAASRYTEVKLDAVSAELFRDIDRDTVDFTPNYDSTTTEPLLLPGTFPNILVSANQGIAVGMASSICGFNLAEVCRTTIEYIKNPAHDISSTLKAPDFPTGGEIIFDGIAEIYATGRGSFRIAPRWRYVKEHNIIEVYELPYTTTAEAVIDKVAELVRTGKTRDISDMRDETDLHGLKLTIDLKRGADPDKVTAFLNSKTPMTDSFACNFNVIVAGTPMVLGVAGILDEWISWRSECVRRRVFYDAENLRARLHLLEGLAKILLDIDKAIRIIRETDEEALVVPNLMIGFGIDEKQAEYVAELRLRNINREYIIKRTGEVGDLRGQIDELENILNSRDKIRKIIISELEAVIKKYGAPRKTGIIYPHEVKTYDDEEHVADYPVTVFLTREGYFKKINRQSLRQSGDHKLKEEDKISVEFEASNRSELIFITNKFQAYKARLNEFEDGKASALGDYLPAKLGMDDGENAVFMCNPGDYSGSLLYIFENGKAARVELSAYDTKSNRRRLTGAYSDKNPLAAVFALNGDREVAAYTSDGRAMIFNTAFLTPKTTRSTIGVQAVNVRAGRRVTKALYLEDTGIQNPARYRARSLPSAGSTLQEADAEDKQIKMDGED